jgi:L-iditol 2-dehydrogenase
MWAYQLVEPGRLEQVEVDAPEALNDGEVLLRTLAGGICGSDTPKFVGQRDAVADQSGRLRPGAPGFPMHEVVGEVLASRHEAVHPGSLVVGWATHSDALAEFVVTNGEHVHTYDQSFTPTDAVLTQPLACVLEALDRVPVTGNTVAVVGLGPIGLLFAHAARAAHASHVVGIDPVSRSAVAKELGIDELISLPSRPWARNLAHGDRPDVIIEAVGHQVTTLDDAITAATQCGDILYFGIPDDEYYPVNMERLVRKNLTLHAGVTRDRRRALARAHAYLLRHPELNEVLVSHRFDRGRVQDAYRTAATPAPNRLKVVLSLADW